MKSVAERTEKYRKNALRILLLRKAMIEAEIDWLNIKQSLNLSQYELNKLKNGELEEREAEVWGMIDGTPVNIKSRDKTFKEFQKALLDRGLSLKEFCEMAEINVNKAYRVIRGEAVTKDVAAEKKIEETLGVKLF